jgi:two-component system phosphate regulon response regulator PhoB
MQSAPLAESDVDVVVVDDDSTTGDVICAILHAEGYRTRLYTDGLSAIVSIRARLPRLVMMDWLIRGPMRGETLFETLRRSPDTAGLPILVCTTESHLLERQPMLRADGADILTEPFEIDDLIALVGRLIR